MMARGFTDWQNNKGTWGDYGETIRAAKKANPEVFAAIQERNTNDKIKMLNALELWTDNMRENPALRPGIEDAEMVAVPPMGFEGYSLPTRPDAIAYGHYVKTLDEPRERLHIPGAIVRSPKGSVFEGHKSGTHMTFPAILKHELTHRAGATEDQARALTEHYGGRAVIPGKELQDMGVSMDIRRRRGRELYKLDD